MTNAAIAASAIVADAAPYIVALSSVVVPGLVAMGLDQLRRLTGLRLQQAAADRLDAMIEDEVGALVAAASDNLATTSIPLGSPIVAAIAARILAAAPDLLAKAGVDPASVARMALGEIGKWQASMTSVSPASPSPTAKT
ncbi:MAG TPA: hypothetical protein VGH40_18615 [Roseiarcus sp.]|jgi:hypothetical protein